MLLYRLGPEGLYAVQEEPGGELRTLYSDPFETLPGGWEMGRPVPADAAWPMTPVLPGKIVGIGRNYAEHARELGNEPPAEPLVFLKSPSAVVGPNATILLPPESAQVEHEGEIAVVLRQRLRRGDREDAASAVLGVTCANDVTARDLQRRDITFVRAKSFDTFCPLGPAIRVRPDFDDLEVVTRVNGAERQRGHTRQMSWGVLDLLVYVSRYVTLEAGDVVLTGTPAGVGPLADGDEVEVEIPGVGVLKNPVEARLAR